MRKRIVALALSAVIAITGSFALGFTAKADTCGGLEEEDLYEPREGDVIKDPALHWAVRSALNTIKDAPILTAEVVGSKNVTDISYELCAHPDDFNGWTKQYWIENLEGLQYATSARMIDICYTNATEGKNIKDLSPLSGLTQLKMLILKQDGITDISKISKLVNLEQLDLSENRELSDVSAISDMKKLKKLGLGTNKIADVSVISELVSLEYVDLAANQLTSLPDMSKLQNVYHLDVSGNQLTNEDVVKISKMRGLKELTLTSNPQITDLKPLARLIYLEKDKTFLPVDDEEKGNLFAAIEVNKLFNTFNISKMSESDLENVGKAIDAYEALTDAQKPYIDAGRVQAAKDNKALVEVGSDPVYYEEYDEGGENQPILDRLEIKVVDKYGEPMSGVVFEKIGVGTKEYTTDDNGAFSVKHLSWDSDGLSIAPKGDSYVAFPEKITYEVKNGKTYIINGKLATGMEKLQFVLIPKDEYVDKTELEAVIADARKVEEEYKYTAVSYKTFSDAFSAAQKAFDDPDATKDAVQTAIENLRNSITGLQKTDVLTELKLKVVDVNGNTFTRPFKFQVYVPGTHAEAWNQLSDADTGLAYLKASPTWAADKTWEIAACYEEPYEIIPIQVTIGVKSNGERYYKTVDGQSVGVDFEKTVTAIALPDGASDKTNERKPDSTVLAKYLEEARQYVETEYTEESFAKLQSAITKAEEALDNAGASQEDYNAAAAGIISAKNSLNAAADKIALGKEIDMNTAFTESMYTSDSWKVYKTALDEAQTVYADKNATQNAVDTALSQLRKAEAALVLRADKTELGEKLEMAKALKAEDYIGGYDELQSVIGEVQRVYDDAEATQEQADAALRKLQDAIDALERKPAELNYACDPMVFRALIQDEKGNALSGVTFAVEVDGVVVAEEAEGLILGTDGVLVYNINGEYRNKKVTVKLADSRYTTTDEHWFIAEGSSQWLTTMTTIDGEAYQDGIKLTYTLQETGNPDPGPDPGPGPGPDEPDPGPEVADKEALKEQIDIAESMANKSADYTEESWQKLTEALAEANRVYKDEQAEQEAVSKAAANLKAARENLVKADKPVVCDKTNIRIVVKDEDGNKVTENLKFLMTVGANRPIQMTAREGIIEYPISDADSGAESIVVMPENGTVMLAGEEYTVSPERHEFTIETIVDVQITAIDGEKLDGSKEVAFVLKKKLSQITEWSKECFTYDGNTVTGLSEEGKEFIKKNPDVIIPDKTSSDESVTALGAGALENCGAKSVVLPATLTEIGDRALAGNELTTVKIPDQVTSIAKNAFADNKGQVTLDVSNKEVLESLKKAGIEGVVFKGEEGNESGKTPEKVQPVKVAKISLSGISKKIAAGKKVKLAATVYPENASKKTIIWKSSNTKVATVNASGVVTMKKKSGGKKVTITAAASDGSGAKATYVIKSMKGAVKKIKISGAKPVKAGKSLKLKAKVTAAKGANKKVTWTSSNTKYAKVSASGKVKTYKAGKGKKVKITVKATDGSNKKKTVTIKIK